MKGCGKCTGGVVIVAGRAQYCDCETGKALQIQSECRPAPQRIFRNIAEMRRAGEVDKILRDMGC